MPNPEFHKIYESERASFKGTEPGTSVNIDFDVDGRHIEVWTTGRVIMGGNEAAALVAFLARKFPSETLLDILGGIE